MKTIVITGSTRGIGYGMAMAFLNRGCQVLINGRTQKSVDQSLSQLEAYSDQVIGVVGDVSDYKTHVVIARKALTAFGKIDIWVNNAGIGQLPIVFYDHDPEKIKSVFEINILGSAYGSQVAYKTMLKADGGFIYNMEGLGSDGRKAPKQSYYGASKRALRYLTRAMALEVTGEQIKIGTLSPGMVATELLESSLIGTSEYIEKTKKIFNILGDRVETVAPYLVQQMLTNDRHNARIQWLTTSKIIGRFMRAPFVKRTIFDE